MYACGEMVGWTVGPLVARATGLGADKDKWRFLVLIPGAGVFLSVVLLGILFCVELDPETYAPVVLEAKATRLRNGSSGGQFRSRLATDLTSRQILRKGA